MSVPTFYANGCHLDLSLSGSRVAVLDSMKIKTISAPFQKGTLGSKQSLNQNEVLPSITPTSDSNTVSRISLLGSDVDVRVHKTTPPATYTEVKIGGNQHAVTNREVNILVKEGGVEKHVFRSAPSSAKHQSAKPPSAQSRQVWMKERSFVKEAEGETEDEDSWEDVILPESNTEPADSATSSAVTKPKKHSKRKRRKNKSRLSNNTSKTVNTQKSSSKSISIKNSSQSIEDAYMDMAVLKRASQLEAYCMPVKLASVNPYKQQLQPKKIDYSKFVNEKAPKLTMTQNKTDILLKKTKDLIDSKQHQQQNVSVSSSTNWLKSKSFQMEKCGENGSMAGNSLKSSTNEGLKGHVRATFIGASAQPLIIKVKPSKSSHNVQRRSVGSAPGVDKIISRLTKIYLSEKQSHDMEELGMEFPCAPPATPTAEMLKTYEYIPCMNDIRSQRAVKLKLDNMAKIEKQRKDKVREEKARQDKVLQKDRVRELRRQQRREIYALNKKMTEFEHKNFAEFCKHNGIPVTT